MNIFYGTCILCGLSSKRNIDICLKCETELPWIEKACCNCGQPLYDIYDNDSKNTESTLINTETCGSCLRKKPPFDKTLVFFHYQKPISDFIMALKFNKKLIYAKILTDLLIPKLIKHYNINQSIPELIIPVPLHKKRLRERGYNQALEIARPIAKKLNLPIDFRSCRRIKPTKPQTFISSSERDKNLIGAFTVNNQFRAKHIAIIDDVMTTGNTVKELSKILHKNGAQTIDIWCCARTS